MERDIEMHGLHQPIGRTIILQADGESLFGAHAIDLECERGKEKDE
jgi:hypothetical protein